MNVLSNFFKLIMIVTILFLLSIAILFVPRLDPREVLFFAVYSFDISIAVLSIYFLIKDWKAHQWDSRIPQSVAEFIFGFSPPFIVGVAFTIGLTLFGFFLGILIAIFRINDFPVSPEGLMYLGILSTFFTLPIMLFVSINLGIASVVFSRLLRKGGISLIEKMGILVSALFISFPVLIGVYFSLRNFFNYGTVYPHLLYAIFSISFPIIALILVNRDLKKHLYNKPNS